MFKPKANFTEIKRLENFYTDGKVQLTSSGEYALCCQHYTINLLHLQTGVVEFSFAHEDKSKISCFHLTSDDKFLFTSNNELLIRQWNFPERCLIKTWRSEHRAPIASMDSNHDGLLCTGSSDASARVFEYANKNVKHVFKKHSGVVSLVRFSPLNDQHLLTSCASYAIKIWNLVTNKCIKVLDGHFSMVTCVEFSNQNNLLYSASRDKVVMIWNLEDYSSRTIALFESIEGIVLLEGGGEDLKGVVQDHYQDDHLVVAGNKGKLSVWNAVRGMKVLPKADSSDKTDGDDNDTALDTDCLLQCMRGAAGCLVTVSGEQVLSLHHLSDLAVVKQFSGNNDQILDIKFLKSATTTDYDHGHTDHLVAATNSHKLRLYNTRDWSCRLFAGHTDVIVAVDTMTNVNAVSYVATASKDNTVRLWKVSSDLEGVTLKCIGVGEGHMHTVSCVTFVKLSSKAATKHVFLASGSNDKTIRVWKSSSDLEGHEVGDLKVKLMVEGHSDDINHITVSPDGKSIATASRDKTAKLWDRSDLKMLGAFKGHKRGVWTVEFSPVNKLVATASADTTIKVWEMTSFTCVKSLEQHQFSVLKGYFMSGEVQFISGDSSGCLKLWDIKSKTCDKTLDCHDDKMWALAVNQSQDRVATGDAEGVIVYWSMVTKEEEEQAVAAEVKEFKLKEQQLQNLMQTGDFCRALSLSISLGQPKKSLQIVTFLLEQKDEKLEKTLSSLNDNLIRSLLEYTVVWNRDHVNYVVCESIHHHYLCTLTHEQFIALDNGQHLLDNLYLNSKKIFSKWKQLNTESTFISFLLRTMNLHSLAVPDLSKGKKKDNEVMEVDDDDDSSDDSD